MYFCIRFCICIHQRIQFCFSALRILPENRIFPFGTGFAYSCMSGKLPDKTKPQQRRLTMFFPILPIATGIIGYSIIQKIRDI